MSHSLAPYNFEHHGDAQENGARKKKLKKNFSVAEMENYLL